MDRKTSQRGDALLLGAFLLSGTAGLAYELLWTRILGIGLGSEVLAVFGVLAGFFSGMAIGAFALQPLTRRVRYPLLLFAILEAGAAAYALFSPRLLHAAADILPQITASAPHGGAAGLAASVVLAAITLLPGTICLGGTLAAVVEAHHRRRSGDDAGRTLGRLYGANTLGAMLGTLAAVYVLMPLLGFHRASVVLALVGASAAGLALWWGKRTPAPAAAKDKIPPPPIKLRRGGRIGLHALIFGTGFVGVGFEVVGVRVISQGLENTVFTFANILAIYLLGTSAGAWSYAKLAPRFGARRYHDVLATLLLLLALTVYLAAAAIKLGPGLLSMIAPPHSSYERQLLGEMVVAAAIFGLPTMLMGALFSHIVAALSDRATGHAYGFNTLGGTLAPFIFGVVAIPFFGYTTTFYAVGNAYLLLFCLHALVSGRRRVWIAAGILLVVFAEALAPASLSLGQPPEGWRVLERREGLFGAISVLQGEKDPSARRLQIGRSSSYDAQRQSLESRMGKLAALLAPQRQRALYLGIGTGVSLSALRRAGVKKVDAVELVPEIVAALPYFRGDNGEIDRDPNVKVHVADTRRFVAAGEHRYDLVVASPSHPARDGAAGLFSLEHFTAIKTRLQTRGLFVQWLSVGQMAPETLRSIARTFASVFPRAHALLLRPKADHPLLAFVGYLSSRGEPLSVPLRRLRRNFGANAGAGDLGQAEDVYAAYLFGPRGFAKLAEGGALNTDLDPRILFDAPRATHTEGEALPIRCLSLLLKLGEEPPITLFSAPPAELSGFLAVARKRSHAARSFLQVDMKRVRRGAQKYSRDAMDALLGVYDIDPSFAPARAALLALARAEPARADAIFARMVARAPGEVPVLAAYAAHLQRRGETERARRLRAEIARALKRGVPQSRPALPHGRE